MNRKELIAAVADATDLPQRAVAEVLDGVLQEIQRAVIAGDKVGLTGFGTFGLAHRDAYMGRNPKTGEPLLIAAKSTPKLSASAWWAEAATAVKQSGGAA